MLSILLKSREKNELNDTYISYKIITAVLKYDLML